MNNIKKIIIAIIFTLSLVSIIHSLSPIKVVEVGSGQKIIPIYRVATDKKEISITFDVAWESTDMISILDTLDKYGVKATFFFCGYWIDDNPELLKEVYARGHEIGSHGNNHIHPTKLNLEENAKEITEVAKKVKDLLGIDINLFRAPYGEYTNTLMNSAKATNFSVIQWTVDSHDWKNKGVDYEVKQVLNHKDLGNGSILLFHTGTKTTVKSLPIILEKLKEQGYSFVPVGDMIYYENYEIDFKGTQHPK